MQSNPDYPLEGRDLTTTSDSEFVRAAQNGFVISQRGTRIVRITSTAVLKIGSEVFLQEALNMEYVSKCSNGQIRVPRVYRHFISEGSGYIVMDFINGDSLDAIPWSNRTTQERQHIILQVMKALECMRTMRGSKPGPVGRGIPVGGLFTSYGAGRTFETAIDMEPWFNQKLKLIGAGDVTGKFNDLIVCHMDIGLRNLVLDKAGGLWILDWAWAGFFPPLFEHASLAHKRAEDPDYEFAQDILHELGRIRYDGSLLALLLRVYQINDGPFEGSHLISGA